jgi:predicted ABC-type ATPase
VNEDQAKQWVKDKLNQQKFLATFFQQHQPSQHKVAFFMAGIPGAGKTEFAQNAIREASPELIPIEHDQLVEFIHGYKPEEYYRYRKAGSTLVTLLFEACLKQGYAFIFDGTLSHENGIRNINKCLKNDYDVIVVYVVQAPELAWELTKARELVKKRSIERDGFVETCNKVNGNLLLIFEAHKTNEHFSFWLIDKQGAPDMKQATATIHNAEFDASGDIEKELHKSYNL